MTTLQIISIVVFVAVMALVVSEKIHRALAALLGAVVLFCIGVVDFDAGMGSIDFNTLGVLCGMMMFVAVVKQSGLFEYVAIRSAKLCKGNPWRIMVAFVVITAVFSALLDNVTTILLIGPMTIMLCRTLRIDATPFLIAEIIASNVGGTATLIGDPPNIMIGSAAGLTFFDFIRYDAPVVVVILVVLLLVFRMLYERKLFVDEGDMLKVMALSEQDAIKDRPLFVKSIAMIAAVTAAFMLHGVLHLESAVIALGAAGIMLLISRSDLEVALEGVEWGTIGFFLGLFVVVGAMEHTGVIALIGEGLVSLTGGDVVLLMLALLWGSALLSAVLDNIPFVATMIPIITVMAQTGIDVFPLWWAISLGACLGGNGSLVGASANVVLSGIANKEGYPISFMGFTKIGFPIMLLTVAIATAYLLVVF
ncbi:ArsB/NhaD family transporter [Gordonibacter massiliensis (ex Traore et al. 2017)]|uniref:ArsB/NhaD family transporter n=1 Tax=Gordonibacter massiliensis (ex Traore et al. 2017) TaxID=1841863 RepID=UPI001C8B58F9|nr:ArsB/NhaD family transporter [Gordonibacter massiliensis (ex Traore et al. 2017)]